MTFDWEPDHVGINVPVLEEARDWYVSALGMDASTTADLPHGMRACVLLHPSSGFRIELLEHPQGQAGPTAVSPSSAAMTWGYGHLCLRVGDVAEAMESLEAAGCTRRMGPVDSPRPGSVIGFVTDPWDNLLELISRG